MSAPPDYSGPDAPNVTASNISSSGKIKLSWDPVDFAAKYEVYRATSKDAGRMSAPPDYYRDREAECPVLNQLQVPGKHRRVTDLGHPPSFGKYSLSIFCGVEGSVL